MAGQARHAICISPDTMNGEAGWWSVTIDGAYDGHGRSIEEALCDCINGMAEVIRLQTERLQKEGIFTL